MQCKPYDINLDEGFTAIKDQENNNNNNKQKTKRERERNAHIHFHTIVFAYICINAVLWSATLKASGGMGVKRRKKRKKKNILGEFRPP